MTYDGAGNLYVCEHTNPASLVMETRRGAQGHRISLQGKELNSPTDVVVRSDTWSISAIIVRPDAGFWG